jgi:hypothetical protein
VTVAIQNDASALRFASKELKENKELGIFVVKQDGNMLNHVAEKLKNDKEVVMAAVLNEPTSIFYASTEMKDNYDIVLEVVKNHPGGLRWASSRLKNNEILLKEVALKEIDLLKSSNPKLNNSRIMTLMQEYMLSLSHKLRDDEDIVLSAIKNSSIRILYMAGPNMQKKINFLTILEEYYKNQNNPHKEFHGVYMDWYLQRMNVLKKYREDEKALKKQREDEKILKKFSVENKENLKISQILKLRVRKI